MLKNILVPIDGSAYSDISLRYGLALAKKYRAIINLLSVKDAKLIAGNFLVDLGAMTGAAPYLSLKRDISKVLQEKSKYVLKLASAQCGKQKIKFSAQSAQGIISKKIVEASMLCDLAIMGQRGENASHAGDLLGSNTEAVVRKISKPLLITPEKMQPLSHCLLAYDGSPSAKNALKFTAELTSELGMQLAILTVQRSQNEGAAILAEAASYMNSYAIKPKTMVEQGTPAQVILKKIVNSKTNLLIMGFHGHGIIRELILGSTTEEVIRKTSIPVLLIH